MSHLPSTNYEKVIQATMDLVSSTEPERITTTQIIHKAGIARSTFYSMFSGKDEIFAFMMKQIKREPEKLIEQVLRQENDFERIMCITNSYLKLADSAGPKMCQYLLRAQLIGSYDYLSLIRDYSEWLQVLIANCQRTGIIQNNNAPSDLLELQYDIATAVLFAWTVSEGEFDLIDEVRRRFLILLQVKTVTDDGT